MASVLSKTDGRLNLVRSVRKTLIDDGAEPFEWTTGLYQVPIVNDRPSQTVVHSSSHTSARCVRPQTSVRHSRCHNGLGLDNFVGV